MTVRVPRRFALKIACPYLLSSLAVVALLFWVSMDRISSYVSTFLEIVAGALLIGLIPPYFAEMYYEFDGRGIIAKRKGEITRGRYLLSWREYQMSSCTTDRWSGYPAVVFLTKAHQKQLLLAFEESDINLVTEYLKTNGAVFW